MWLKAVLVKVGTASAAAIRLGLNLIRATHHILVYLFFYFSRYLKLREILEKVVGCLIEV